VRDFVTTRWNLVHTSNVQCFCRYVIVLWFDLLRGGHADGGDRGHDFHGGGHVG
jgi:hypothetical protein